MPSATAQLLSWTHYEKLIQVSDADAREEELRAEIETQKEFYYLQKKDKEEL